MERHPVSPIEIVQIDGTNTNVTQDLLAVEEPLEIRLNYGSEDQRKQKSISVTMRTVGHDFELAIGFLFTEGIIQQYSDLKQVYYCQEVKDEEEQGNVVIVHLNPDVAFDIELLDRHFYTTSSCGVCGKASIEAIQSRNCQPFTGAMPQVSAHVIHGLNATLIQDQTLFKHTGGIHAAALFSSQGELITTREDIGRHNAVDKVIGAMLHEQKLPLDDNILFVSGRAGFELVQKAIAAGIQIMAAVGAPSSLAVKLSQANNLTLLGFVRNDRFNIYSAPDRILK